MFSVDSSMSLGRPFVINVEGNIGSGKSSLLTLCAQDRYIEVLPEPVDAWADLQGVDLLADYYKDPKKYGMTFQTHITLTMLKRQLKPNIRPIRMMERSLLSVEYCFVKNMVSNGILQPSMQHVLSEWYEFIKSRFASEMKVDLIVYLDVAPEVAFERVVKRQRSGESGISLEYLQQLDKLHSEWLSPIYRRYQVSEEGIAVYVIDANQPIEKMWEDFRSYLGMWKIQLGLYESDDIN